MCDHCIDGIVGISSKDDFPTKWVFINCAAPLGFDSFPSGFGADAADYLRRKGVPRLAKEIQTKSFFDSERYNEERENYGEDAEFAATYVYVINPKERKVRVYGDFSDVFVQDAWKGRSVELFHDVEYALDRRYARKLGEISRTRLPREGDLVGMQRKWERDFEQIKASGKAYPWLS